MAEQGDSGALNPILTPGTRAPAARAGPSFLAAATGRGVNHHTPRTPLNFRKLQCVCIC